MEATDSLLCGTQSCIGEIPSEMKGSLTLTVDI